MREGLALAEDTDIELIVELNLELELALDDGADREAYEEALASLIAAAEKSADPRRRAHAQCRVARHALARGEAAEAIGAAERAAVSFDDAHDGRGRALAWRLMAIAHLLARDVELAESLLLRALREGPHDDTHGRVVLEQLLGSVRLEQGDLAGALELLLRARDRRRSLDDPAGMALGLIALAEVYVHAARLEVADVLLARACKTSERVGDDATLARCRKDHAKVALLLGDTEQALRRALEARQLARTRGLVRLEQQAVLVAVRAAIARHELQTAEPLLHAARRRADAAREPIVTGELVLLSAHVRWLRALEAPTLLMRDRLLQAALVRARAAFEHVRDAGLPSLVPRAMALLADVLVTTGDIAGALTLARAALERASTGSHALVVAEEAHAVCARALLASGAEGAAVDVASHGVALLDIWSASLSHDARSLFWTQASRASLRALAARRIAEVTAMAQVAPSSKASAEHAAALAQE